MTEVLQLKQMSTGSDTTDTGISNHWSANHFSFYFLHSFASVHRGKDGKVCGYSSDLCLWNNEHLSFRWTETEKKKLWKKSAV